MDKLLRTTKTKFTAIILFIILSVVVVMWLALQTFNNRQIAVPASADYVHSSAEGNLALSEYLEDQKDFEAHFVSLATEVKNQDSEDLTQALAVISVFVVVGGIIVAIIASRKLIKPVEEAYQSQERFIQDAAHELRNPLAAMTAALQKANSSKADDQLIRTFRRQTKRLIHINEDLLFLERHANQEPVLLRLDELLADVVEEVQPLASSKNVDVIVKSDQEITKKMTSSDYVRLVKNIIDNAVKYSKPRGKVMITQVKEKGHVIITVIDQGIGIPKKDLETVGNRFFRASNTGPIDGTGLGLAIVQKILNIYGGKYEITSSVGKGTKVVVTLPA